METTYRNTAGLARPVLGAIACAAALALSSCGGGGDYDNKLRPPSPINITAFVSDKAVSVSPSEFGAGPIVLIVTNQSAKAQDLTIETDQLSASTPGVKQSTGPISPRGTGRLKIDVKSGSYTVHTGSDAIQPAKLTVGAERASAQNQVLQP
jgi:hypothetical protein